VRLLNGLYCQRVKCQGQRSLEPLYPQPDSTEILVVERFYASGPKGKYRKRVTWLNDGTSFRLVEYLGVFRLTVQLMGMPLRLLGRSMLKRILMSFAK